MSYTPPVASFPNHIVTDAEAALETNRESNALAVPINSTDLVINLAFPITGVPATVVLTVGNERILCISKDDTNMVFNVDPSVGRGFDGSVAESHREGDVVRFNHVAWHHNKLLREIQAIERAIEDGGLTNDFFLMGG